MERSVGEVGKFVGQPSVRGQAAEAFCNGAERRSTDRASKIVVKRRRSVDCGRARVWAPTKAQSRDGKVWGHDRAEACGSDSGSRASWRVVVDETVPVGAGLRSRPSHVLHAHGFRSLDVLDAEQSGEVANARFAGAVHVDFLVHPAGFEFAPAWKRRETVEVRGVAVHFVALEDLMTMKRAAGRAKDLGDLEALEEIRRLRTLHPRRARRARRG